MHRDMTRRAFTLIELLVVIAIIALLLQILLPALAGAREVGRSIACASQMRQIGLAIEMYADDYRELYPPRASPRWVMLLQPYYDVDAVLLCPADKEGAGGDANNVDADRTRRSYFMNGFNDYHADRNPSAQGTGASNDRSMPRAAIWQPSDTGLFAEKRTESGHYYLDILEGLGNDFTELEPSRHGDKQSNYLFADTHVTPLRHPNSLTPVNIWGVTSWGRQSVVGGGGD